MESIKDRSTLNWTTDDRTRRTSRRRGVTLMALFLAVGLISVSGFAQQIGTELTNRNTLAHGAVFLNDNLGGHWWVTDQQLGICEIVPQNLPNQAPDLLNFCNATAVTGGQVVVGDPAPALALPAGSKFVYIADTSTASVSVARMVFSPSANGGFGGFTGSTILTVPNVNGPRGVFKPGMPLGLALLPHNGVAANGGTQDLYVSYSKSGDITRVDGIDNVGLINRTPTVTLVGSSSDGSGIYNLVAFGNDLYVSESGGFGFSRIQDPSGILRPPCTAANPCAAAIVSPSPSVFPGGLTTDWVPGTPTTGKSIFIGDATPASATGPILKYDPATTATSVYSLNINPSYTEQNNAGISTTFTAYLDPMGLGYNAATGELLVADDPQGQELAPIFQQGHTWSVPIPGSNPPSITSIAPATGARDGGDLVTITGFNLAVYNSITGAVITTPNVSFGPNAGISPSCAPAAAPPTPPVASTCTVTSPAGFGVVDVRVAIVGQSSATSAADLYTYAAPPTTAITVDTVTPNTGATIGGTMVTITGQNLANYDPNTGAVTAVASFNFGAGISQSATCDPTAVPLAVPVISVCHVRSPAGAAGTVNVQASLADANNVLQTSAIAPTDQFTYIEAVASLYAWGVQAAKGGATWLPGALGGHWWATDEGNGFCREDPVSSNVAPFSVAGSTLHALNLSVCADDVIGGAGQAAYDANVIPGTASLHYVYIASNAVFSTSIFRLTLDANTETLVPDPFGGALATAMAPLSDLRTLKPNGLALGPDGNVYFGNLVTPDIGRLTTEQDPRSQTVTTVAQSGDGRGTNGTVGFIGNYLYMPGNRAAEFFDITQCPLPGGAPCGMASVPAPTFVFVAGVATDPIHKTVYFANSPGGAPATFFRYDASGDVYVPFAVGTYPPDVNGVVHCTLCSFGPEAKAYITGGLLPAPGTPNGTVTTATTVIRPWDQNNHPTAGIPAGSPVPATFAFVFGMETDPLGNLILTEDPTAGGRCGRGTVWMVPYVP